jgi:hypothetical protein
LPALLSRLDIATGGGLQEFEDPLLLCPRVY